MSEDAPPAHDGESTALVPAEVTAAIKDLPAPQQQRIVHTIQEAMVAVVRGGPGPQIDAETAKILSVSIEKDNDNKFKYLTQKQTDSAAAQARRDELQSKRHSDLMKPAVRAVIVVVFVSVVAGLWFIQQGREAIGSSILTGIFGSLLGFLGGLGTAKFAGKD